MHNHKPQIITSLSKSITRLPGIGPRLAKKISYYLLSNKKLLKEVVEKLTDANNLIRICSICRNFSEQDLCEICSQDRNKDILCIVKEHSDLYFLEDTKTYNGYYYILGINFSPSSLAASDHIDAIKRMIIKFNIKEIILALPISIEGNTLTYYIAETLKDFNIKITNLAMGIPIGADFEYIDTQTLSASLKYRQEIVR